MRLISCILTGALTAACVPSISSTRDSMDNRQILYSNKEPDALAGCVADQWQKEDALPAATQKTETGWRVHYTVNTTTIAVVDIYKGGTQSKLTYNSEFTRATNSIYLPGVKACL